MPDRSVPPDIYVVEFTATHTEGDRRIVFSAMTKAGAIDRLFQEFVLDADEWDDPRELRARTNAAARGLLTLGERIWIWFAPAARIQGGVDVLPFVRFRLSSGWFRPDTRQPASEPHDSEGFRVGGARNQGPFALDVRGLEAALPDVGQNRFERIREWFAVAPADAAVAARLEQAGSALATLRALRPGEIDLQTTRPPDDLAPLDERYARATAAEREAKQHMEEERIAERAAIIKDALAAPRPKVGKSAYVLELSVDPGGARYAHAYAYGDVARLERRLALAFERDAAVLAHLDISYDRGEGTRFLLWTAQRGVLEDVIDLHPYLTITTSKGDVTRGPCKLDDRSAVQALEWIVGDVFANQTVRVHFTIDIEGLRARLPKLRTPRLEEGESTMVALGKALARRVDLSAFAESYLLPGSRLRFGGNDLEEGGFTTGPRDPETRVTEKPPARAKRKPVKRTSNR